MSRVAARIECSEGDLQELQALAQDQANPQIAARAAMVLASLGDEQIKDIASLYDWRPATVIKWRKRFAEMGIAGLRNLPRGKSGGMYGAPFQRQLQELLEQDPPGGASYWTGKLLAEALDVPLYVVSRYLRKEGIRLLDIRHKDIAKPHAEEISPSEDSAAEACREDLQGSDNSEQEANPERDTCDIEVIVRVRNRDGVLIESSATVRDAMPDLSQFNTKTMDSYLRDLDAAETALSAASDAAVCAAFEQISKTAAAETEEPADLPHSSSRQEKHAASGRLLLPHQNKYNY